MTVFGRRAIITLKCHTTKTQAKEVAMAEAAAEVEVQKGGVEAEVEAEAEKDDGVQAEGDVSLVEGEDSGEDELDSFRNRKTS